MFELKNRFVFHRTGGVDIQMIHEFLQPIHDFLPSDNIVKQLVYIFPVVSDRILLQTSTDVKGKRVRFRGRSGHYGY